MARTSPQPNRRPAIGGNFDLLKKALVAEGNPVRFRQGKVIAYSSVANTVDVQIAGATDESGNAVVTAGIKLFGNFTPDVNQAVWLVTDNTDIFAIGQLAPYGLAGGGGGSGNVAYQANAPTSPSIGDVWIESDVDIYDVATYAMTFTNKTLNLTSNTLTGTTAQFNTALSDGDFATLAGTETLTNKSLTSPSLTGTPTTPTASAGTSTTQIASTAYVMNQVSGMTLQSNLVASTTATSISSTSFVAITGLSASITPKYSTSKVLITLVVSGYSPSATNGHLAIYKNGSTSLVTEGYIAYQAGEFFHAVVTYIDSPATTSAVTYAGYAKKFAAGDNNYTINYVDGGGQCRSTILVQEIAA